MTAGETAPGPLLPEQDDQLATASTRLALHMKKLHRHIASQVMSAMQDQLQDEDLSFSQMSALHQLRDYAPLSVGGLAERLGLSLPAASHLTDRLVVRGLAQRRENPDDRRAKLLALSDRGGQIVDEMDRRFTDTYRVALLKASPDAVEAAADSVERLLIELLEAEARELSSSPAQNSVQKASGTLPVSTPSRSPPASGALSSHPASPPAASSEENV